MSEGSTNVVTDVAAPCATRQVSRIHDLVAMSQKTAKHLGLLFLDHRSVFFYPHYTRFCSKQGRKATIPCSDPSNDHQKDDAQDADEYLGNDATRNLHKDPVSSE